MTTGIAFEGSADGFRPRGEETAGRSRVSGLPIRHAESAEYELLLAGRPGFAGAADRDCGETFLDAFKRDGTAALRQMRGRYALALRGIARPFLLLATDRFASVPLFYVRHDDGYVFAESAALLPGKHRSASALSRQAIYNYLYFHMIPGPGSIYTGVSKVLPASAILVEDGRVTTETYWRPDFSETTDEPFDRQAAALRQHCAEAVRKYASGDRVGCFLSGGLDSSTVLGYLSESGPARAFTIGFDAPEYDETPYARVAARHFSAELNEYRVSPADIVGAVREIATAYDEPFGNSSAVPTLFCARFARSLGVTTLLAGDGGDELFAGNARYAKQKVFEAYFRLPPILRKTLFDPLGRSGAALARAPGVGKVRSYVRQANVPLPDRLETYNHLVRYGSRSVFADRFLSSIDETLPARMLRERYDEPGDASALNRMLYLDWKFTLADNDLRKVVRMCQLAGVEVEFPLLDEELVEFSTRVPSKRKLRGTRLRYFYRRAMRGFLPEDVLRKRKHGFGLPFGVWLVEDPALRDFSYGALSRLEEREIFAPAFIARLRNAAEQDHAAYYGAMIWVLVMLEEWLSAHH